jgi:segregation and condensation protein B
MAEGIISSATADEIDEAKEKEDLKRLEAVFFISGRWLNMQELISLSDLNPIIIRELIDKLKERYNENDSAIEIVEKDGVWKMDVRAEHSDIINKLATGSAEFSKAEQETLAIVAFKQPIKQSVIIKIRGNKAYDHLKKFSELGLIKKKREGHTHILSLSDDFYDYFSVQKGENILKQVEENVEAVEEVLEKVEEVIEEEQGEGVEEAEKEESVVIEVDGTGENVVAEEREAELNNP